VLRSGWLLAACLLLVGAASHALGGENDAAGKDADSAAAAEPRAIKRVVLLYQGPDGHAWSTHEYQDGVRILAGCLQGSAGLQTVAARADEPWEQGPELLEGADGVLVYLAEGAKWIARTPERRAAFERLAQRKGGLVVLHWGMGTRDAANIEFFVSLFGGCHGGPDRKYKVLETRVNPRSETHPVLRGISPFVVEDEFYYRLKLVKPAQSVVPLLEVEIDGEPQTVAWAWTRPDGGRSCGFSGGHFHRNWEQPEYRRLMAQAIVWSVGGEIPQGGLPVDIPRKELELQRPKPNK